MAKYMRNQYVNSISTGSAVLAQFTLVNSHINIYNALCVLQRRVQGRIGDS